MRCTYATRRESASALYPIACCKKNEIERDQDGNFDVSLETCSGVFTLDCPSLATSSMLQCSIGVCHFPYPRSASPACVLRSDQKDPEHDSLQSQRGLNLKRHNRLSPPTRVLFDARKFTKFDRLISRLRTKQNPVDLD